MSALLIAVVLLLLVYKLYQFVNSVPPNAPPCIPRLPVVGSYWYLLWRDYYFPYKSICYYTKKLKSKIISCFLGPYFTVIACDYDSVKEVLTKPEFDGRPTTIDVLLQRSYGKSLGIFFTEGLLWQEQRRFTLRHTRDFGFGRRHENYEADIMEELALLVHMLKEGPVNDREKIFLKNGSALFPEVLYHYSANSIWNVMFGERFDRADNDKTRRLCSSAMMFQRVNDTIGGAIFYFAFLKHFGNMFRYTDIIKSNLDLLNFIQEHLDDRKRKGSDYDRGMVDRYLKEMRDNGNISASFSEKQLMMNLLDFMFPALSALPSVVVHAIKFAMHHPRVLKNIRDEIDRVVGRGRLVTWEDRKSLPYTEATIREAMRYETLTPLSVFHKTLKDTTLNGFDIPKNTIVITNLAALNHDPDLWGDPEIFRPERFLNEDGTLGKDNTFVFGFGHRVCAGETFARYNMFGLFAILMQNFDFSFLDGEPTGIRDVVPGLIVTPKDTWLGVQPRC